MEQLNLGVISIDKLKDYREELLATKQALIALDKTNDKLLETHQSWVVIDHGAIMVGKIEKELVRVESEIDKRY